jgi:hypothetical protein
LVSREQFRDQQPALIAVGGSNQDHGVPFTRRPPIHTPRMFRVAAMSRVGSPSTSTRSARRPGAITPRSVSPKVPAASEVAPRRASAGVSPEPTSRSSSSCSDSPCVTWYGAVRSSLESVPARITAPASRNVATVDFAWR